MSKVNSEDAARKFEWDEGDIRWIVPPQPQPQDDDEE